jgi:hypothetical protein
MKPACPRLFEAEALRDGRLTGAELARFKTHLLTCASCAREAQALDTLAESLRSSIEPPVTDELHLRRERLRLLAAFNATLVRTRRVKRAQAWQRPLATMLVFAGLSAAGLSLGVTRWRVDSVGTKLAPPEPVLVQADRNAKWSRRLENQLERVTLESGVLSIRVSHSAPARRLLVILPDGELEDIGTTFSVSVDAGHTTRVTVQDGSVVLRLHGKPPLALGAGDSWTPPPAPVVAPSASSVPPAAAPRSLKLTPSPTPTPALSAEPEPEPESDPSAEFRAAMSALNTGDSIRAAALFSAFVAAHPRDSRAEDAAYLRVLALQRAGSSSDMKRAATEYLSRYPRGFRRAEVEPLSR